MSDFDIKIHSYQRSRKVSVIGIGGTGIKVINKLAELGIKEFEYISVVTNMRYSNPINANTVLQLDTENTINNDQNTNYKAGEKLALKHQSIISNSLRNSDLVFVVSNMVNSFDASVARITAHLCRQLGSLTIGLIVPDEFIYQSVSEVQETYENIMRFEQPLDVNILISYDKKFELINESKILNIREDLYTNASNAMNSISDYLFQLTNYEGLAPFLKSLGKNNLRVLMGSGLAEGEKMADKALQMSFNSLNFNEQILIDHHYLLAIIEGNFNKNDINKEDIKKYIVDSLDYLRCNTSFVNRINLGNSLRASLFFIGIKDFVKYAAELHYFQKL